ncbi:MAG: leucyl/phenylalanyl-tRNA--protein transferase [Candidatus Sericytochromatia bacterium]|nr:leucyl/phenylalanyl-tRNA--protein transferase [Candidatus Sericytochromatia bacterium]
MDIHRLSPELIEMAYRQGIFPMAEDDGTILWFSPDPRAIIPLAPEAFHVPRSLAKTIREGRFEVRIDHDFAGVLAGCADRRETWISDEISAVYRALHQRGLAHSVEAWQDGALVGGLYGVSLGGAFMGESMFSRATDASKVCLVALVERLRERGYTLLDSQFHTPHLARFGLILIPRETYCQRLAAALPRSCRFYP